MRFATFDVEAVDWEGFRVAGWWTSEGDTEAVTSLDRLAKLVGRYRGRVWAHFLGRYDVFFLPAPSVVVLSGSSIVRAQHGQAQLHDSWELFRSSLASVGRHIGHEKLENRSERMAELTDAEAREHALNDAAILGEAMEAHRKWWQAWPGIAEEWPTTSGACAMELLEAMEPETVDALGSHPLTLEEWHDQYGASSGARTEVFQLGHVNGRVTLLDVRSSYPSQWLAGPLPCGPWRRVEREEEGKLGVYLCEVQQAGAGFPVVAPEFMWRYSGLCWCTSEELRAVREARGTARVVRGWASEHAVNMGHKVIPALYTDKAAGIPWGKPVLNALCGKTLQSPYGTTYYRQDSGYVRDVDLTFLTWFQRPLVGAFIHGRARLHLWRAMEALRRDGWRVYYVDTDGLQTDCPPELLPPEIRIGLALGEWKLEGVASEAVYLAPKTYGVRLLDGEERIITKGIPRGAVSWENLLRAAQGYRVPVEARVGLEGFLSVAGAFGPRKATIRRSLCLQTGGKKRVRRNPNACTLWYRDSNSAR